MSLYVYIQVPGADPSNPGTQERIAVEFEAGSLPKLQSFKSAVHSNGKYRLLVGGRYIATAQSACIDCLPATFCLLFRLAGLHPFGGVGFTNQLESHVLFVLDTTNYITIAAALPEQYYNTVGLMNAQSYQLVHNGKKLPLHCWRVWLLSECKDHDNPEYCKLLCIRSLIVGRS